MSDRADLSKGVGQTVRERIVDALDAEEVHGLAVTARRGETVYVLASSSTADGRVALTTVVVDLAAETVKVHGGNSLWLPADSEATEGLTKVLGRTTTDLATGCDHVPATTGISSVDVDDLLATELAPDEYAPEEGLSPAQGEPPEAVHTLDERLRAAGIDTAERYIRLRFGGKEPWSHDRGDVEYLVENYGVYAASDDPLVLVDVDHPEHLDAALPETFVVSSPHGDDDRAHHYYAVDDPEAYRDGLGKWNAKPSWGDVRAANQYVVGPGSQLDGCDKDPCDGRCSAPDGGVYRIINDAPIAEVPAEWLLDLLGSDPDVSLAADEPESSGGAAPIVAKPDEEEGDQDVEMVECHRCGESIPETRAAVLASDETTTIYACRGGCDE